MVRLVAILCLLAAALAVVAPSPALAFVAGAPAQAAALSLEHPSCSGCVDAVGSAGTCIAAAPCSVAIAATASVRGGPGPARRVYRNDASPALTGEEPAAETPPPEH